MTGYQLDPTLKMNYYFPQNITSDSHRGLPTALHWSRETSLILEAKKLIQIFIGGRPLANILSWPSHIDDPTDEVRASQVPKPHFFWKIGLVNLAR